MCLCASEHVLSTHVYTHMCMDHMNMCIMIVMFVASYYNIIEPSHERPSQSKTPRGAGRSPARAAPHYAAPQKSSSSYNRQVRHLTLNTRLNSIHFVCCRTCVQVHVHTCSN